MATTATVRSVVAKFLKKEKPQVLALKGKWGVGKTYLWNKLLKDNKENIINFKNYAYVSLFGISSITQLHTAVFIKAKPVQCLGEEFDAKSVKNCWGFVNKKTKSGLSTLAPLLKDIPFMRHVTFESFAPHLIKDTIICFDDFERLNLDLIKPEEILGVISELKEEKNCKVVLIFNEGELKYKEVYQKYREKVIDIELLYEPTPAEAVDVVLSEFEKYPVVEVHREILKKYTFSLKITNIRILRKIIELAELIYGEGKVSTLHKGVMEKAIFMLVLLVWCYFEPSEEKPTLDFITKWNSLAWGAFIVNKTKTDAPEAKWAKILIDYGWSDENLQSIKNNPFDLFGHTIRKVIECGYTEETGLYEEAEKLDAQIHADELDKSYTEAWSLFHSFADNERKLVGALRKGFKKTVQQRTPLDLNQVTMLLRELNPENSADGLIDYYIKQRDGEPELFNLSSPYSNSDLITDQVIWERFNNKYRESRPVMLLRDAVAYIASNNGWSREHIEALKRADEEAFYTLFKEYEGQKTLRGIFQACLQFENMQGCSDEEKSIGLKARNALIKIGKESPLNAIRIKIWTGISSTEN